MASATVLALLHRRRRFLDWLAANAPDVTTPEAVRRSECETFLAELDQQTIRVVDRSDAAPLNPSAVVVLRRVTS